MYFVLDGTLEGKNLKKREMGDLELLLENSITYKDLKTCAYSYLLWQ